MTTSAGDERPLGGRRFVRIDAVSPLPTAVFEPILRFSAVWVDHPVEARRRASNVGSAVYLSLGWPTLNDRTYAFARAGYTGWAGSNPEQHRHR
jgi:hypothetical protein